jgi:MurNAc alpha-1-phosphate uridylyltransferase
MIDQAFILAAGFAKRMRPLTDALPKPLVMLGDKPILTHTIDKLVALGVKKIVVNGHHHIQKLYDYMPTINATYPDIEFILSAEDELLETGGGAVAALTYLDQTKPFFMINGDAFWVDNPHEDTLDALANAHLSSNNDMTLLLQSIKSMPLTDAKGDYSLKNGQAMRSLNKSGTHMFTGVRVLHPGVLDGYAATPYSFLDNMDDTENKGKLGGFDHKGAWYHISTPQDLADVNTALFPKHGKAS